MEKIDLRDYPVIDLHCHPFEETTKIIEKDEFPSLVTFGGVLNARHLLLYKQIIRELSRFLSSPPTPEGVVEARNARSIDYSRYLEELFGDVKLEAMLVDDGYSEISVEKAIPPIEIDEFRKFVSIKVHRVTRIEPLIKNSLDTSTNFKDLMNHFTTILEEAVKKMGAVGLKSITAYRTGLDILKSEERAARRDFKRYKEASEAVRLDPHFDIKRLRDHMIYHTVMKCIELDTPFQIHTGLGDVDVVARACNPVLMFDFLKLEEVRKAKIVLTHAGYPYAQEAAWLSNVFPNVYLDLSVYTPFTHVNIARRILDILEMAPANKILYASDAFKIPELHWLSVRLFKRAMGMALEEMISFDTIDEKDASTIARMILYENAERLYRLERI